jgi:AcrR family transcriptional regulator
MPRNTRTGAAETKRTIVDRVVDDASINGLEGVTIGRLAGELGMSKAGFIGPFGNKEQLQLAALKRAGERFREAVWEPAADEPAGLERLAAIADAWLSYLDGDTFPGGCFLTQASAEFDARPGAVHDEVRRMNELWLGVLAGEAAKAIESGAIEKDADPAQIAFELNAIAQGVNQAIQLDGDRGAIERGRTAMERALRRAPRRRSKKR